MAESESGQDKTEEPTEKRRREARKKGQLPRSRELNTLSVLMAGAGALLVYGAHLAEVLMGVMRNSFEMSRETAMRSESMLQLLGTAARGAAEGLWPILLVLLCAALIGPISLGGWLFSGEALAPKFSRMNPLEGIKRMFSAKSVLELFKALIKFVVVLAVAVLVLRSDKEALLALLHQPLQTAIVESVKVVGWSAFWIALALAFGAGVYHFQGPERGLEYFAGYVLEKSLSMDNLFVFLLVFGYFQVPAELQQRVLLWGALGALVMRGVMIGLGIDLIHHFSWILYVFGGLLLLSGLRMLKADEPASIDPARNPVVRGFRRLMPVTAGFEGKAFFTRRQGRLHATPLFLVLLVIETSDLAFAVDSIPAVFAVTDSLAIGALRWCQRHGLAVPDDVAIMGCDNIDFAEYAAVPLSSVNYAVEVVSRLAVDRLMRLISAGDQLPEPRATLIDPELVIRESTMGRR